MLLKTEEVLEKRENTFSVETPSFDENKRVVFISLFEDEWLMLKSFFEQVKNDNTLTLSPRQTEIIEMWADGRTDNWIAEELGLSYHTVKGQAVAIFKKMNVHNKSGAVAKAFRVGLLN